MYDDRAADRHARHGAAAGHDPARPTALTEAGRPGELLDRERFARRVEATLHAVEQGHETAPLSIVALRLLAEGETAADDGLAQGCAARIALALRAGDAIGRGEERMLLVLMRDTDGDGGGGGGGADAARDRVATAAPLAAASPCASRSASRRARPTRRAPPRI